MIRFEDVGFGYGTGAATLEHVSFHIPKGDFVALIGANGAGKSTTARLVNGLLKPQSGCVTAAGMDTRTAKTSALARHIGFLFQNPDRQICQNTVEAEIRFGLERLLEDPSVIDSRVQATLDSFQLPASADPFTLSRGQRQRVALASILAAEPEILVLDEPTTGLDYRECVHIMDIVQRLNREQHTTVLMVCHDMELVLDYAPRALVLCNGTLLADAPSDHVFSDLDLMARASLLPPQIPALAQLLGKGFENVRTPWQMADTVAAKKGGRA